MAPGWLDEEVKMLVPERKSQQQEGASGASLLDGAAPGQEGGEAMQGVVRSEEGEELDRAFGGMEIR